MRQPKKIFILLFTLVLCVSLLLVPVAARADFGDFSGDNDWGDSGDWGGGNDYDWGSDDDDDWGSGPYIWYSGDNGGGGGTGRGSGINFFLVLIIIIVILIIVFKMRGSAHHSTPVVNAGGQRTDASMLKSMEEYLELDPEFNGVALTEKLSNLYVQMQNCWTARDIEPIRPFMTDAIFEQMSRQLTRMKENHMTNYVDRISVQGIQLRGWYQNGGNDCLVASVRTRIVDYTKDDQTGQVVKGDPNRELFMEYEWILVRPTGSKTGETQGVTDLHCPNCGAPLEINASARCPYCDAVIMTSDHDWAIQTIKGIFQRSVT